MIAIAAAVHIAIGAYFFYLQVALVVWLSILDVLIYTITFFINKADKVRLASFIIVIKISLFAVTSTILFGTNVNAHWIILATIFPTALYLDFTSSQRIFWLVFMVVLVNFMLALPHITTPVLNIYDNAFLAFFFGNIVIFSVIATVIVNNIVIRKISNIQAKEVENFRHASNTDPLTKISNRRYADLFFDNMAKESNDFPTVFALIDIDNFKGINDTFGHDVGDSVLVAIAEILQQNTRHGDLVCRWGGEEFLLCLTNCSKVSGLHVLEKIRKIVEETVITPETSNVHITITCGASLLLNNDIKATLVLCDKKLYEGKKNGKNKIVF